MNSYYQNLLEDVVSLFSKREFEKANTLIDQELSMPYVPREAMEALEQYKEECRPYLSSAAKQTQLDLEQLIHGSESMKEKAVTVLLASNLRQFEKEVQSLLLDSSLLDEFKGELIEGLMDQKVDECFRVLKAQTSKPIDFNPIHIVSADQDPVLLQARQYIKSWLEVDNPFMEGFCQELLCQEVLERRPLDFSKEDPKALAASLVRMVYQAMNDSEGYEEMVKRHKLEDVSSYPLLIEKRGEYCL